MTEIGPVVNIYSQIILNGYNVSAASRSRRRLVLGGVSFSAGERPHSALGNETPQQFATSARARQTGAVPFPSALARPQDRVQAEATATSNGPQDKP